MRVNHGQEAALKVLLSAFACEPGKGSEFAVGWNWTVGLARLGHEVTVLTRSVSRPAIESAVTDWGAATNAPRFEYFDLSPALRWETRGPLHLHHVIWQHRAARFAQKLHAREHFDCVHHVTYAGLRSPSFMGQLGIPFIFGPVGGGETAPWRLRQGYTSLGLIIDALRDMANAVIRFEPGVAKTFARATKIYVTSRETLRLLPSSCRQKATIELAIGSDSVGFDLPHSGTANRTRNMRFRVLYAGRFVDYKGMHLGLPAFAKLLRLRPNAHLTMVGDGPVETHWRRLAQQLGIAPSVVWLPWQKQETMGAIYDEHDVFFFPSLHDSGGLVVLEAMRHGLPVVCLKLGGPGVLVDDQCGRAINTSGKTRTQVIVALADALNDLTDFGVRSAVSGAAVMRCQEFSWQKKVERIYGFAS